MLRSCFLFIFVCSLLACSGFHGTSQKRTELIYNLVIEEEPRMRFQGKGAGAGMMLSSSMGAMGIAIGVAIDEGIGKDIQSAVEAEGFDIRQAVQIGLDASSQSHQFIVSVDVNAPLIISLKRYGFKTHPGQGDIVTPEIEGKLSLDGQETPLVYPIAGLEAFTLGFDEVKTDGQAASSVFRQALTQALTQGLTGYELKSR